MTAVVRQLDEKVLAFSEQLAEAAKKLKAGEDDCDSLRAALPTPSADWAVGGKARY